MERTGKKRAGNPAAHTASKLAIAAGIGVLSSFALLLLFAWAITRGWIPWGHNPSVFTILSALLGGLISGRMTARVLPYSPVLTGLLGGALYWLLLLILGALLFLRLIPQGGVAQTLLFSLLGGLASVLLRRRKKPAHGKR